MLEFTDKPYDPVEPNPNRLVIRLAQHVNRKVTLKSNQHKVKTLELMNAEAVDEIKATGKLHVLFVANHSTHSDPQIMVEAQRQLGMTSLFMAAYDVFLRSKFDAWVMRKTGAFSVDRDGSDTQAMNSAVDVLVEGEYGLTIFPEGNVYFMNDRVQPFMEGAAYIAMKAQKQLTMSTPIWVVPVAIKATFINDQREVVVEELKKLAADAGIEFPAKGSWSDRIKTLGMHLLRQRLELLEFPTEQLDSSRIRESLEASAEVVIAKLEDELEQKVRPRDSQNDRVRKLRRAIHQVRLDPEREAEWPQAEVWADHAMFALRILSYAGDYLDDNPSFDRIAETCEKLVEDFTSESHPPIGERKVFVRIANPIPLSAYLEDFRNSSRKTLDEITRRMESSIQLELDTINSQNTCEGANPF